MVVYAFKQKRENLVQVVAGACEQGFVGFVLRVGGGQFAVQQVVNVLSVYGQVSGYVALFGIVQYFGQGVAGFGAYYFYAQGLVVVGIHKT